MMARLETCQKRACYLKREHGDLKRVICEIDANGVETFCDQEPGEVRWFPFLPSQRERSFVRSILNHNNERSAGNLILDLDVSFAEEAIA